MATNTTGQTTDFTSQATEFSVESRTSDAASEGITRYTPEFAKYNGFYRKIPELRAVINKFASWTFGRGIKGDKKELAKLGKIKGNGKDSPRGVCKNQWKVAMICGDSFAHIIKDNQGRLTNLKPLNTGMITILSNEEGIITGYESFIMGEDKKRTVIKVFDVDEIYHLSFERIADENHGVPFPEALEELIEARNEGMSDLRIMYHRNIKPIQFFEAETNNTAELSKIEATINSAYKKSENVVISKGVLTKMSNNAIGQYATLDSLNYIKFLVRQFVTACGMPEVIMGWGENTTEASSKIIYLAFQQDIEDMQLYNEEMIEAQLNIVIELEFPADLMENIKETESKAGNKSAVQPENVKAKI